MSNNTATIKTRKNLVSTRTITMTALLAAISYVLAFLEFPVPLSPSFARMDLSDLPALIGTFAFWTGYRSDDRIDKKYITASVNINRRNW